MKIKKFAQKSKYIQFVIEQHVDQGEREIAEKCPEAPLASLTEAMEALKDFIGVTMGLPDKWLETVKVRGFSMSYTQAGTRSCSVEFTKTYPNVDKVEAMRTPLVQIDPPAEVETEKRGVATEQAAQVCTALAEVEKYIGGDRQQMRLDGVEVSTIDGDDDPLGLDAE